MSANDDYVDCWIRIHDKENATYEGAYKHSGKGKINTDALVRLTIERIRHWVAEDRCTRPDLELLGRALYRLLFDAKLRKEFEATYEVFQDELPRAPGRRLR